MANILDSIKIKKSATVGDWLGIGTLNPGARLHVYNGSAGSYTLNVSHDDLVIENSVNTGIQLISPNSSYQYIAFGDPDSVNTGYIRYYHTNNEMVFRTNGGDRVIINSSGNVGINDTNPLSKLTINSGGSSSGFKLYGSNSSYTGMFIANTSTGSTRIYMDASNGDFSGSDYSWIGQNNDLTFEIATSPSAGDILIKPNDTERVRAKTNGDIRLSNQQNGVSRLELYQNRQDVSNIGVWTIAAYNNVEVANLSFFRGSGSQSGYTKIFSKKNNASSLEEVVQFGTNDALTSTFRGDLIVDSGDVGIGTSSPSYPLDVNGSINSNSLFINDVDQISGARFFEPLAYEDSYTRTTTANSTDEWVKVISVSTGPRRIRLSLNHGGDNTNAYDEYLISHSSYNMQTHIFRLPGSKYNTSKIIGVKAICPSGSTQEVWVKVAGVTSSNGAFQYRSNVPVLANATVSASAQSSEPTSTTGSSVITFDSDDRNDFTTISSGGAKLFGDLKVNGVSNFNNYITFTPGTSIPSAALSYHTNGYLYMKGGGSGAAIGDDSYATSMYCIDNGNIEFNTAGTGTKMVITGAGNVGINNTSPSGARLCVNGTSGTDVAIKAYYDMYLFNTLFLTNASFTKQAAIVGSSNELILKSNGGSTEGIRIDPSGNVGIGNTDPQFLLHIGGAGSRMRVGPYYTTGGDRDFVDLIAHGTDSKVYSNNERFHIQNDSGDIIINPSGKVGIGTTLPSNLLHVQKDQDAETAIEIMNNNTTGSSAAAALHLSVGNPVSSDPRITMNVGDGGLDWVMGVDNSDGDKFKISGGTDSHKPQLGTNDRLTIDSSGTVTAVAFVGDGSGLTNLPASSGNITIPETITHVGDTDTYISFNNDVISLICGGVTMVQATENAVGNDVVAFGGQISYGSFSGSTSGYAHLQRGLFIQWGSFYSNTDSSQVIYFPTTFTTTYAVFTSLANSTMSFSTSNFIIDRMNDLSNSTHYFFAIGTKS